MSRARGEGSSARRFTAGLGEFLWIGGITPFLFPLSWLLRARFGLDASDYAVGFLFFYGAYLINDPHFAVTYLLFYKDARARAFGNAFNAKQRARYVVAGILAPLVLGAWAVLSLATRSAVALGFLIQLMFLLVGWHYVKQGFGVLTVLAARRGVRWTGGERVAILAHCFAGWAYAWASPADLGTEVEEKGVVYTTIAHGPALERFTHVVFLATLVPLVWVLVQKRRREGQLPIFTPLLALLCSVWSWTIYTSIDPLVRYATPALHSIQYLYFVWLLKGSEAREREGPPWFERSSAVRLGFLAVTALGLGCLLFHLVPSALDGALVPRRARFAGPLGPTPYFAALFAFVNIHHYFMDYVIWRRDNPDTRYLRVDAHRSEPTGSKVSALVLTVLLFGVAGCGSRTGLVPDRSSGVVADAGGLDDGGVEGPGIDGGGPIDAERTGDGARALDSSVGLTFSDASTSSAGCPCTCQGSDCEVTSSTSPVVLAEGQALPSALAVDGTQVYWLSSGHDNATSSASSVPYTDGGIFTCPVGGCNGAPTALAIGLTTLALPSIAIGGGNVYWGEFAATPASRILDCATAGCNDSPTELAPGSVSVMVADDQSVYWTPNAGGTVLECPIAGCGDAPVQFWPGQPTELTTGLAMDETYVYWLTSDGALFKCAKTGCGGPPTTLVSAGPLEPRGLAVDANNAYWIAGVAAQLWACAKTGCHGAPTALVSGVDGANVVATDGENVYWTDPIGYRVCGDVGGLQGACVWRIGKCAVTGCDDQPTTLAVQSTAADAIAVDAMNVYWTSAGTGIADGQILMLPK